MEQTRPKGAQKKPWGRFKIACAVLFFSGLRLNEVAFIKEKDILELVEHHKLQVYQAKVDINREVRFRSSAIPFIKKAYDLLCFC